MLYFEFYFSITFTFKFQSFKEIKNLKKLWLCGFHLIVVHWELYRQRSHQLSYRCNLGIILRFVSVTSVWCSTEGYANFGSQKHEKTIDYFHYVTTHQNIIQSIYWSFLVLMSYKENSHFTPWIEFEWKIPCRHILRLDDLYDCTLPRKKCTHITQVIQ